MVVELTPDQRSLQHRLQDIPASVRPHVKIGFESLADLDAERRRALYLDVIENFNSRASLSITHVSEVAGCERRLCADMVSAMMITISSIIDLDVNSEDFLRFIPEDARSEKSLGIIRELLEIVLHSRSTLKAESETARIASAVLPSFVYADLAIDVRISFDRDDNIKEKVPVLIAYIKTDSDSDGQWLQFSSKELDVFVNELQKMQKRLKVAAAHV